MHRRQFFSVVSGNNTSKGGFWGKTHGQKGAGTLGGGQTKRGPESVTGTLEKPDG